MSEIPMKRCAMSNLDAATLLAVRVCGVQAMQGHICSPPPPAEAREELDDAAAKLVPAEWAEARRLLKLPAP